MGAGHGGQVLLPRPPRRWWSTPSLTAPRSAILASIASRTWADRSGSSSSSIVPPERLSTAGVGWPGPRPPDPDLCLRRSSGGAEGDRAAPRPRGGPPAHAGGSGRHRQNETGTPSRRRPCRPVRGRCLLRRPLSGAGNRVGPDRDRRLRRLEGAGRPASARRATRHLHEKLVLVILDNFEQVIPAATAVAGLLQSCPGLHLLVTSREPLRVRDEQVLAVPPLALPPASAKGLSPEQLMEFEAVELFIARARAARPDFRLTEENASDTAEICRRLDGLPLAIELAAARLNLFSPERLRERLENRLQLLRRGARDLPARQQTLARPSSGAIGCSSPLSSGSSSSSRSSRVRVSKPSRSSPGRSATPQGRGGPAGRPGLRCSTSWFGSLSRGRRRSPRHARDDQGVRGGAATRLA